MDSPANWVVLVQVIPSGLPRNLEAAIQRYGSATYKAPAATVLDPNGKLSINLTYGNFGFVTLAVSTARYKGIRWLYEANTA